MVYRGNVIDGAEEFDLFPKAHVKQGKACSAIPGPCMKRPYSQKKLWGGGGGKGKTGTQI